MIERLKQLQSFDIVHHHVELQNREIDMIFLSSLTSQSSITSIIEGFLFSEDQKLCFFNGSASLVENYDKAVFLLLSGQCLILINEEVYALETRNYPTRGISHPSIEKSIRGSHDSFNENILHNVGLIRRRIRNDQLKFELNQEGKWSLTDIALCYVEDKVNQEVLSDLRKRMNENQSIEINNERNLVEVLYGKTTNPYPHVRYSERPDICAIHLLQGYVIVLVDNMPSAMILPTTYLEQLQQIEEYTQTPLVALLTRTIRYMGILVSLYLLPFVLVCLKSGVPFTHDLIQGKSVGVIAFQILICELLIEWIRQSFLYAPTLVNSMMGFLVVFVLGDFGIEMGAYTKEILLVIALCNLGNFLTPSYEIALANKLMRIMMTILTLLFSVEGFCIGVLIHFISLLLTKSMKASYLYPLFPFDSKEIVRIIFDTNIYTK